MYIATIPNRKSPPAILLREGYREDGKVKNRTLANLSKLPPEAIEAIRRVLKGDRLVSVEELFEVVRSVHHGHVLAVLKMMRRLGFPKLLATRASRERSIAQALIAARIVRPDSKLSTTRWWRDTTIPEELGVQSADEDDVYTTMDWLLEHQSHIEKKLADRHLEGGALVMFDLTSSYFEGQSCSLAALGHNRDGKKGKLQVNYGIMTDARGCPVALSVFKGNTGDPKTLLPQVEKARDDFGIEELVMVGDRGMISQSQIDELKKLDGVAWLTALRTSSIRKLVEGEAIQLDLFDERNLFEFAHSDYPGERLVACRNPELAKLRAAKRKDLLAATERELEKVRGLVARRRVKGTDKIGVRVGRVVNKYKVAKHFDLEIADDQLEYHVNEERVAAEAALDGIYVIRTSVPKDRLSADDVVRHYKGLANVERAFRTMKGLDLLVRPIFHRLEDRVRAHLFLCMLAYYVQWHLIEAWRPLMFHDEDLDAKSNRDPVAPAERSEAALRKARTKILDDGSEVHSFRTLLAHMSTIVRNTCQPSADGSREVTLTVDTTPNPKQQQALDLIAALPIQTR